MKVIFCLLSIFFVHTFGRILSPLDEEWQDYDPSEDGLYSLDSSGQVIQLNLEEPPSPPPIKGIHYYLHTRKHQDAYEITKDDASLLKKSDFEPSRKTKVLIHGYLSSSKYPVEEEILEAYLGVQDVNVVAVDWSKFASVLYNKDASETQPVGQDVAELIDLLVSAGGANVSDIHIIGHSLGAHVAAFAANAVTSGRITRISGLDPALPLFGSRPPAMRLDPTDADVVDCIHTCGKYLGFYEPLCTHDFYPNGGRPIQPGCGFDWYGYCSHSRSFQLFAASIAYNFPAQACDSFLDMDKYQCTGDWTGLMGETSPTTPPGIYILMTTGTYPYII